MGLMIDPALVLYFILGLAALYVCGWLLLAPFRLILKLVLNAVVGAIVLILLNLVGGTIGVMIPLNPLNALITGFFGLPGVALLFILQLIFL